MTQVVKQRDSNMELARIVAMAMILVGHFFSHGLGPAGQPSPNDQPLLDSNSIVILAIRSICTGGVGLFMLISGYYGIKLRWKSIISFILLCVFYNAVSFIVNTPLEDITARGILNIFFVSKTNHWFFQGYWWILLTSPILNLAINKLSIKSIRALTLIAFGLTAISSCMMANPKGNTALFLYCLYFIGGYLRRENIFDSLSKKVLAIVWVLVKFLMIAAGVIVYNIFHKEYGIIVQNNSPFVVLSAIVLFLFFRKVHICSSFINMWATTIVAALFIQDMILHNHLYQYVTKVYIAEGLSLNFFAHIACLVSAIFIAAFLIEYLRKFIADKISSKVASKLNRISDIETILIKECNS